METERDNSKEGDTRRSSVKRDLETITLLETSMKLKDSLQELITNLRTMQEHEFQISNTKITYLECELEKIQQINASLSS